MGDKNSSSSITRINQLLQWTLEWLSWQNLGVHCVIPLVMFRSSRCRRSQSHKAVLPPLNLSSVLSPWKTHCTYSKPLPPRVIPHGPWFYCSCRDREWNWKDTMSRKRQVGGRGLYRTWVISGIPSALVITKNFPLLLEKRSANCRGIISGI